VYFFELRVLDGIFCVLRQLRLSQRLVDLQIISQFKQVDW
jgi:hypothetical protein